MHWVDLNMTRIDRQRANYEKALRDFTGYLSELQAGCSMDRRKFIHREAITCDARMASSYLPKLRRLVDAVMTASQ